MAKVSDAIGTTKERSLLPSSITLRNSRNFAIDGGNVAAKIDTCEVNLLSLLIGLRNPIS
jgi:hypothetical protein